jgi:uncharacterized protein YjbJ (UPF0337 family)
MNADILKGKWKEIKGEAKQKWGKLTDDDLTQIDGKEEQLLGLLQKRYGYAKEKKPRRNIMGSSAAMESPFQVRKLNEIGIQKNRSAL